MFPFYGSKWNIAKLYPVPAFGTVIEPFAGSAAYSLFHGVEHAVLVDADPVVVSVWRYLIGATVDEVLALPDLPAPGDSVLDHDLSPGARALIGFWLNRGSAVPKLTRTAYSARTDKAQLNWGPRAKERIASQLEHVRGWQAVHASYEEVPDVALTWFVDPPYVDKGRHYRARFNRHDELGEWVQSRRGQVIVCEGVGAEWLPFRPLGHFKTSTGRALEVVWHREKAPR